MRSRSLVVLLVLLAVVLAGCTGTNVDGEGSDGETGTTDTGYGPTTDDGDDGDSPVSDDGDSAEGEMVDLGDPDTLLREAGSFTAGWAYTFEEADEVTSGFEYEVAVDLVANHSREFSRTSDAVQEVVFERYNAGGMSYMKYGSGEESVYMAMAQDTNPFAEAVSDAMVGEMSDYDRKGTETFDGVTVTRYEFTDRTLWQAYGLGTVDEDDVEVTDFTLVVLVDEDGLARSTSWTLVGETEDGERVAAEWRYTLTRIGETVVAEPDWLETAKSQGMPGGDN